MKFAAVIGIVLLSVGATGWTGYVMGQHNLRDPRVSTDRLEAMGNLVVAKVYISDVKAEKSESNWGSQSTVLAMFKGDALISIDMRGAKVTELHPAEHTAVVTLPFPTVLSPRINHDATKVYDSKEGWWASQDKLTLMDKAYQDAQHDVEAEAGGSEYMAFGRDNAEILVKNFYQMIGWKVEIRWQ